MNHRTATVKVGLLTVISLVVLITTVIWLRGRTLGGGQSFEVFFRDVDGLRQGAAVQFMGIRVGFVDEVVPVIRKNSQYRVKIRFTVTEPNVKLPRGSYISLEQSGIIGEKFVEVTPPRAKTFDLILTKEAPMIHKNMPIMVAFREGLVSVGKVLDVEVATLPRIFKRSPDYRYQLRYIIDLPGYLPPTESIFQLVEEKDGDAYLVLEDDELWHSRPSPDTYFTMEEPLRLKEFLEQQLASAESLKVTNEKINKLLSDEAIESIQGTLKNSEQLTAQATSVLAQANDLFSSTAKDLKILVASTQDLTSSVVAVSNNINDVAGNPEIKANIQKTVRSVEESTAALSALLNEPALKQVMSDTKITSQNAAELMKYLKTMTVDNDLSGRLNESVTLLNSSLTRLSNTMESLEAVSEDKEAIRSIIEDTQGTAENLNKFSERLNKRFLLFRLLF